MSLARSDRATPYCYSRCGRLRRDSLAISSPFFSIPQLSDGILADYKRPPWEQDSPVAVYGGWGGCSGERQELTPVRSRALHERAVAGIFPQQVAGVEGGYPEGGARDAATFAGRKPKPSGLCRPRLLGDGAGDRAAGARASAQADRPDRCCPAVHRRWCLRLLRGNRRADLAATPRSAPDRDPVDHGPGGPRTARTRLSRRLIVTAPGR